MTAYLSRFKRTAAEDEAERQEARDRNWSLMLGYGHGLHEDEFVRPAAPPESQRQDLTEQDRRENQLRSTIANVQSDVVGLIERAMVSWLRYYFGIDDGDRVKVLIGVAEQLDKTAHQLHLTRDLLESASLGLEQDDLVVGYARAVFAWASALELLAHACRIDVFSIAEDGLMRFEKAAAIADQYVKMPRHARPGPELEKALETLEAISPRVRASKRSVEQAKEPWRHSLISAGSPLRWTGGS